MPNIYNYTSLAEVLNNSTPEVFEGTWKVVLGGLINSGKANISGGVVEKVVSVTKTASSTSTTGETLSALCAMDVTEGVSATGASIVTMTPKAAICWTPKTVALCAIAGALGLDLGFRVGQNLVNLYFGDDWNWSAPGIFDVSNDRIRTYVDKDGITYYDEETIVSFTNRLYEIGAFSDSEIIRDTVELNNFKVYNNLGNNSINGISFPGMRETLAYAISSGAVLGDYSVFRFIPYSGYNGKWYNLYIDTYYSNDINFSKHTGAVNGNVPGTSGIKISGSFRNQIKSKSYVATLVNPTGIDTDSSMGVSYELQAEDGENRFMEGSEVYTGSFTSSSNGNTFTYDSIGVGGESLTGVSKQDGAVIPTSFPLEIPSTYPNWFPYSFPNPDYNPVAYPVELPNTNPDSDPSTNPQPDAQTGKNPNPDENPDLDKVIGTNEDPSPSPKPNPDPPPDDTGDVKPKPKPAVGIVGTGFVAIYNPTQSQLSAFSQYLWSDDFIDNIKKLFQDPMNALVGLHMIYATPVRGKDNNIICGYLDSGVNSRTVSDQYISINCGSIKINKYFGNVLDYNPYTKIQCYLPFIGIVDLDTNELMDKTLSINYNIDVLTGACLAQLSVDSDSYSAVLYTFSGNCAVQLPITGGDYSSIISNVIGVAASVGATIASGGTLAPVAVAGVASGLSNSRFNVSKSGSLGSNAGALGNKIPYLIITRPIQYEASKYNTYYGYPSNNTITLSYCSGFTRVKDVHVEKINATDSEISEIESLLKEGVII